jgi:protein-L-isoaspartate(D-aspartate) O-methyltransferase
MKSIDKIDQAFEQINRAHFVPEKSRDLAHRDIPLPIGYNQTISQPTTVKLMLKWLKPKEKGKILDVGSGSGWTSALLAEIVGREGRVFATERVPELKEMGEKNVLALGITNVAFFWTPDQIGLPNYAPYDRILVSASALKLPEELLRQLDFGGKMVIPVGNSIKEISKNPDGKIVERDHFGFRFVPLIN